MHISAVNTCYELESWQTPDGTYHYARLPDHLQGTDFGSNLKSYILYQYHHHVTQPLLLEQLLEWGILISSGQLSHMLTKDIVVLSDDAGQFNVLHHALCWIHIERNLQKIHTYTAQQRKEPDQVLKRFWQLYQQLKAYRQNPDKGNKEIIIEQFDKICDWQTQWIALQKGLDKLRTYKQEMLVCLEYPSTPLHNNQSERDIREYVKKRKISGSTRSENGRKARDTFTSLKKTCRKMNISF